MNLDPARSFGGGDAMFLVYDSLMRPSPDGVSFPAWRNPLGCRPANRRRHRVISSHKSKA
jgi:hypothetical protein